MKVLVVGGTFDENLGKGSGLIKRLCDSMQGYIEKKGLPLEITVYNGGSISQVKPYLDSCKDFDFVFWWPNVPGNVEKLRNVKEVNPRCILIGSKRNFGEYETGEVIRRALEQKHNLCVEFSKNEGLFTMTLLDPLGNMFYQGQDIDTFVHVLVDRMLFLKSITRVGTSQENLEFDFEINQLFLDLVKEYAEVFHSLIQAQTTRFLGNCSTRCMRGFPSTRSTNGLILVSRRNVDKRYIDSSSFVPCFYSEDGKIKYLGESKPSVDTPIQMKLYKEFPNINYMIHSHCYIEGAPFTSEIIPCGGLEEVSEILNVIKEKSTRLSYINLKGHGSIAMASSPEDLKDIPYYGRILPERQYTLE